MKRRKQKVITIGAESELRAEFIGRLGLLRAAPAIRRGLYPRPRLFSSSLALFVRSGNAVKAPRWVNSRQLQDTPLAQE